MDAMCSERWGCAALLEFEKGPEKVTEEEEEEEGEVVEEEVVVEEDEVVEVVEEEASEVVVEEEEEEVLNCAKFFIMRFEFLYLSFPNTLYSHSRQTRQNNLVFFALLTTLPF